MDQTTDPAESTAIVFAGGDLVDADRLPQLPDAALLIAADGGLAQADHLGLRVDVVVGDLDSADPAALEAAVAAGAVIERHPENKDATDLELALDRAMHRGCRRVVVVGGLGGRIDHLLANALLLGATPDEGPVVEWWADAARVSTVRPGRPLHSKATEGDAVSLIPVGGPATEVTTMGLRWPLAGDTLEPGSTRGVSNEATATRFTVATGGGVLLVVHHHQSKEP